MQPGLFIEVLPREPQIEGELSCSAGIFVRNIISKWIAVIPLPFYEMEGLAPSYPFDFDFANAINTKI